MLLTGIVLLALHAAPVLATDGDLDLTFGAGGTARTGVDNISVASPMPALLIQPDGKVVSCTTTYDSDTMNFNMLVARWNANGILDTTFGSGGRTTIDFDVLTADACTAITRQADGKLVVAGFTAVAIGAPNAFAVVRLDASGALDPTFGSGTGKTSVTFDLGNNATALARAVAVQPDGRIVIVGSARLPDLSTDFAIARLLPDGSRDSSFNLTGKVTVAFDLAANRLDDAACCVAIDDQGRIVVAGTAGMQVGGTGGTRMAVARLLHSGVMDGDFDEDGRITVDFQLGQGGGVANALVLQHDGNIVLAGQVDAVNSGQMNFDMAVARLLPSGESDGSFGFNGKTLIAFDLVANGKDTALTAVERSDGRLVFGGSAATPTGSNAAVVQLKINGDPDEAFGSFGKKSYDLGFTSISPGFSAVALQGTHIIAAARKPFSDTVQDAIAVRLQTELLFANGFD